MPSLEDLLEFDETGDKIVNINYVPDYGLSSETWKELMKYPNRISDIFTGRNVMVTGGTGFLGKVMLEKLLRKCPGIGTIYVLTRGKKGKSPEERMNDIFEDHLFHLVRKAGVNIKEKVVVIPAAVANPDLELSPEHRQMLIDNVNVVYHCAASVRFEECLQSAIFINVRGTKLILDLASEMKHLELFCHMSTAYCQLHTKILEEKFYPPPQDPYRMIELAELMDKNMMEDISDKLRVGVPNSYSFSKALAETLVEERLSTMPIAMFRLSVLVAAMRDPLPGWTDNINGPFGIAVAIAKGVCHSMYVNPDYYADFVPIDMAASGILLGTYSHLVRETNQRVFNVTSSSEIKLTWRSVLHGNMSAAQEKYPYDYAIWYPSIIYNENVIRHYVCVFFLQWIPALLFDIILRILGYEPVLIRVQKKIHKATKLARCYLEEQFLMDNTVTKKIREKMNPREAEEYYLKASGNMKETHENIVLGIKLFFLKESMKHIPNNKRHLKRMYVLHVFTKLVLVLCMFWLMYKLIFG